MIRPLQPGADWEAVKGLWHEALDPEWPVLPDGLALIHDGYVAEDDDGQPVGVIVTDPAGVILFLAVAPDHQRRGIGTRLLDQALADFRADGLTQATVGSGTYAYFWAGIPVNRPDALAFFDHAGWPEAYVATDLVQDLQAPGLDQRLAAAAPATEGRLDLALAQDRPTITEALAFEDEHFPQWSWAFRESGMEILTAQGAEGRIRGTLLMAGPGRVTRWWPLVGDNAAAIGCVGVAPDHEGQRIGSAMVAFATALLRDRRAGTCLIDWVVRVNFYGRLGYRSWRSYSMRTLTL